jgi:hypothetical protein
LLRDARSCDLSSPEFTAPDGPCVAASAECVARRGTGGGGIAMLWSDDEGCDEFGKEL